jgi:hypothetical protein
MKTSLLTESYQVGETGATSERPGIGPVRVAFSDSLGCRSAGIHFWLKSGGFCARAVSMKPDAERPINQTKVSAIRSYRSTWRARGRVGHAERGWVERRRVRSPRPSARNGVKPILRSNGRMGFGTLILLRSRCTSTGRTRMGGVHHDEKSDADYLGCLWSRRPVQCNGGVTWMRHANLPARSSRGCVTA